MKGKNEKNNMKEEQQDEKTGAVDQIKKKYGFSHSGVSWHIHWINILLIHKVWLMYSSYSWIAIIFVSDVNVGT